MKNITLLGSAVLALLAFPALGSPIQGQEEVSYKNDVFPVIHDYCLSCHQKMPFGMNGGLAKDKIAVLKKWVNQGA